MFDSAPRALLFRYPFAYLLYIFYSILLGKENAVLGWGERLDELERHYAAAEGVDEDLRDRILGELLIVRKFTLFNDVAAMRATDEEVVRRLHGRNSYITLPDNEFTFGSPHYLYLYYRDRGGFRALADLLAKEVGYARFSGGCGTGSDALALAEYALETGNFKAVAAQCRKAMAKAEGTSQAGIIICAGFSLTRLRLAEGKIPEVLKLLAQMEREAEKANNPVYNTTMDLCRGYVFACLGQPERIPPWLQVGEIKASDFFSQGIAFNYIVYGKTLLAWGKYAELEQRIEQFEETFSVFGNRLGLLHNRIFEAAARCHLYGMQEGAAVLENALAEAEADDLVLPFAESSPHIMGMLKIIVQRNSGNDFLNRVLALCREYESVALGLSYPAKTLSPREMELLSLAAQGLSRKEAAACLHISEETVKTHFKNIYQKLGVNSKMAAIKLARERGYMSAAEL